MTNEIRSAAIEYSVNGCILSGLELEDVEIEGKEELKVGLGCAINPKGDYIFLSRYSKVKIMSVDDLQKEILVDATNDGVIIPKPSGSKGIYIYLEEKEQNAEPTVVLEHSHNRPNDASVKLGERASLDPPQILNLNTGHLSVSKIERLKKTSEDKDRVIHDVPLEILANTLTLISTNSSEDLEQTEQPEETEKTEKTELTNKGISTGELNVSKVTLNGESVIAANKFSIQSQDENEDESKTRFEFTSVQNKNPNKTSHSFVFKPSGESTSLEITDTEITACTDFYFEHL
jgi:hypothetical protein